MVTHSKLVKVKTVGMFSSLEHKNIMNGINKGSSSVGNTNKWFIRKLLLSQWRDSTISKFGYIGNENGALVNLNLLNISES